MFKVAIIGASGYTGGELLRMLLNHPEVEITDITSRQYDGVPAHKIHPHIRDSGLVFNSKEPDELDADVVFTATPHGASMKIVPEIAYIEHVFIRALMLHLAPEQIGQLLYIFLLLLYIGFISRIFG